MLISAIRHLVVYIIEDIEVNGAMLIQTRWLQRAKGEGRVSGGVVTPPSSAITTGRRIFNQL